MVTSQRHQPLDSRRTRTAKHHPRLLLLLPLGLSRIFSHPRARTHTHTWVFGAQRQLFLLRLLLVFFFLTTLPRCCCCCCWICCPFMLIAQFLARVTVIDMRPYHAIHCQRVRERASERYCNFSIYIY